MSMIALRAGGSKSTLWAYFPCKKLLFEAVVLDAASRLYWAADSLLYPAGPPRDVLNAFAADLVAVLTSPESLYHDRMVIAVAKHFPALGHVVHDKGRRRTGDRLSEYLAGEMQAGWLRLDDPSLAARHFLSLVHMPRHLALMGVPLPGDAAS